MIAAYDSIKIGRDNPVQFANVLDIKGKLTNIAVVENSTKLKIGPYTGKTATLSLNTPGPEWKILLYIKNEKEGFYSKFYSYEKSLLLPGTYEIYRIRTSKGRVSFNGPGSSIHKSLRSDQQSLYLPRLCLLVCGVGQLPGSFGRF